MRKIIALAGPKGVGKSTVANQLLLNPNVNQPAGIMSFAGPLKDICKAILPPEAFTAEGKENPDYGLCGVKPRVIMQTIGTDWGRQMISKDIWVDAMRNRIATSALETIILDDLRFENEAELVRELGGSVIELTRADIKYTEEHISECRISKDYIHQIIDLDTTSLTYLQTTLAL